MKAVLILACLYIFRSRRFRLHQNTDPELPLEKAAEKFNIRKIVNVLKNLILITVSLCPGYNIFQEVRDWLQESLNALLVNDSEMNFNKLTLDIKSFYDL
jgi:hypothetical protein